MKGVGREEEEGGEGERGRKWFCLVITQVSSNSRIFESTLGESDKSHKTQQ